MTVVDLYSDTLSEKGIGIVDICNDVRRFNEPNSFRKHIGLHLMILHRITQAMSFPDWLAILQGQILQAFEKSSQISLAHEFDSLTATQQLQTNN